MPSIRDREEGYARRRDRVAMLKKGPGVFVYLGTAFDVESVPTPKLVGAKAPVLDADGLPVKDAAGRQVFRPSGAYVTDENGNTVYGGEPKIIKHKIAEFKIRGYEFPKGKKVQVSDAVLALKLRGMDCFEEVEGKPDADKPSASDDAGPSWEEIRAVADKHEVKLGRTTSKQEAIEKIKAAGVAFPAE